MISQDQSMNALNGYDDKKRSEKLFKSKNDAKKKISLLMSSL